MLCSLVQCIGSSIGDEEQISSSRKYVETIFLAVPIIALFDDAPRMQNISYRGPPLTKLHLPIGKCYFK